MRFVNFSLLAALIVAWIPATGQAQELVELAKTLQASVVVLEVDAALGEPRSTGTGFFVTRGGEIVTNYHVIQGAQSISARTHEDVRIAIDSVLAIDEENDLALLLAEPGDYIPLRLARSSTVETGSRVVVLGNPLGLDFTLSEGIISAVRGAQERRESGPKVPHLQISAPISFGSSGSPVMTLSGDVVGVVVSGFVDAQNLNFAIPVSALKELQELAAQNPDGVALPSPWIKTGINLGISFVFFGMVVWFFRRMSPRRA